MSKWKITIPSYKRSNLIINKTIKLLDRLLINYYNVYIFILKEDENDYKNCLKEYIDKGLNLIIVEIDHGLHHMRNYITKYFPNNTMLLSMDDDIDDLYKLNIDESISNLKSSCRYKLRIITSCEFYDLINYGFELCTNNSIGLFGIYPIKNGYFMKDSDEITYNLKFCVGTFWGCINNHNININIEEKEDYERTILFYKIYNKILRFNNICVATKYYKNHGGMQYNNENRILNSKNSVDFLVNNYSEYCKINKQKKSGIWEIKLI
jgi:hypothetical protein